MKATLIRDLGTNRAGAGQRLYRLDPPITGERWDDEADDYRPVSFEYVVTSAVSAAHSGPETYIFGADESGTIVDWSELRGSFRGGLDHSRALEGAGYSEE